MKNEYHDGLKMLMAACHRKMILDDVPIGGCVFEWGSGGTSAWLADELKKKAARLWSVEHHPDWFKKIKALADKRNNWKVQLLAPEAGYTFPNATRAEEDNTHLFHYCSDWALDARDQQAEVVLIDGVARGQCLNQLLAEHETGDWDLKAIYLHDTHRDWYDAAIRDAEESGWKATRHEPGPDEYPACITRLVKA